MRRKYLKFVAVMVFLTFLLGCIGQKEEQILEEPEEREEREEPRLEPVVSLSQLNFELEDFIGEKVWVLGFYGDDRITGDGVGFLVLDFYMLIIDKPLSPHSFVRLDGNLPPYEMNSAEVLVYGEVKDFAATYNAFCVSPTPLITVEDYHLVTPPEWGGAERSFSLSLGSSLSFSSAFTGVKGLFSTVLDYFFVDAQKNNNRALIISGGVDKNSNHARYKDEVAATHKKLKDLGYTDDQIDVVHNNGEAIKVNGKNIVDSKATKEKIKEIIEKYKDKMPASSTLTIFVSDHGAGYNPDAGYNGEKTGSSHENETGKTYPESELKIDCKAKVYRQTVWTNRLREAWWVYMDKKKNQLQLYKRENGKWVLKGSDTNKDGRIEESETGQDIDGDGDKDNVGWSEGDLGNWQHRTNQWDTNKDGQNDVRARWDGAKYVVEKKKNGTWGEVGKDTNGDNVIDSTDGGIDWNGDGDKNDRVGFHEGICLWGTEVLWDDELAKMLEPLQKKGIHILVKMCSCHSGGFIGNLKWIVEKIVTFAGEDTYHHDLGYKDGKWYSAAQRAFLNTLDGTNVESWDKAFEEGKKADDKAWDDWKRSTPGKTNDYYNKFKNEHQKWEKPLHESGSMFGEDNGSYIIVLEIPKGLEGTVYDIEIYFGLQSPKWAQGKVLEVPEGFSKEEIPGGIRITSDKPFPSNPVVFRVEGLQNAENVRVELTGKDHTSLGYIKPSKVPHWVLECTLTLSTATGMEYREASTEEKEKMLDKPETQYIEDMKADLRIYIRSTHPSVTEDMRECAKNLLEYLNSDSVSQKEKEQIAKLYWETIKSVLSG